ncbi:MAG: ABC transporter substrate-binding protein [Spirochaetales bacterium]|nr:ABC transporter substrate-binding protein [Candidatus Physcosoma equi]
MHKRIMLTLVFALLAVFALCAQPVAEATPSTTQMRIVSLGPNLTETIFALGKGDSLVGRTDYCDYPEAVFGVQSIGDLYNPNIEMIVSLTPDLVLCSSVISPATVDALKAAGLKVEVINPQESLEGTYVLIEKVGELTGAVEEAKNLNVSIQSRIEAVANKTAAIENKKSVYYCVGYGEWGDYTATGDTFVAGILEAAGGNNIAKNGSYWMFDKESLVAGDPEVFLLPVYAYSYPEGDIQAL